MLLLLHRLLLLNPRMLSGPRASRLRRTLLLPRPSHAHGPPRIHTARHAAFLRSARRPGGQQLLVHTIACRSCKASSTAPIRTRRHRSCTLGSTSPVASRPCVAFLRPPRPPVPTRTDRGPAGVVSQRHVLLMLMLMLPLLPVLVGCRGRRGRRRRGAHSVVALGGAAVTHSTGALGRPPSARVLQHVAHAHAGPGWRLLLLLGEEHVGVRHDGRPLLGRGRAGASRRGRSRRGLPRRLRDRCGHGPRRRALRTLLKQQHPQPVRGHAPVQSREQGFPWRGRQGLPGWALPLGVQGCVGAGSVSRAGAAAGSSPGPRVLRGSKLPSWQGGLACGDCCAAVAGVRWGARGCSSGAGT